jgi:prevent-host-death family protein
MREIGVRQLKQTLSETLAAVSRGEPIRVTRRGRPLADIVPAGTPVGENRLRQLIATGRVVPSARSRPTRDPELVRSSRLASELVLSERDLER